MGGTPSLPQGPEITALPLTQCSFLKAEAQGRRPMEMCREQDPALPGLGLWAHTVSTLFHRL